MTTDNVTQDSQNNDRTAMYDECARIIAWGIWVNGHRDFQISTADGTALRFSPWDGDSWKILERRGAHGHVRAIYSRGLEMRPERDADGVVRVDFLALDGRGNPFLGWHVRMDALGDFGLCDPDTPREAGQ